MSQWAAPPSVVILSGTDSFLRNRELREAISTADEMGHEVWYIQGSDTEQLRGYLSTAGLLFEDKMLVVVEDPEDVNHELVVEHHLSGDTSVCVLLYQEGGIKPKSNLAKVAEVLPAKLIAKFEKPKPWEETDHAVSFVKREAKRFNIEIEDVLAESLVKTIGVDLGILHFEVQKLSFLLSAEDTSKVTAKHIKGVLGIGTDLGPKPIVEALGDLHEKSLISALTAMRKTNTGQLGSAVLRVCAFLGASVRTWLQVASLLRQGLTQDRIAERTKLHPYLLKKVHIPIAKRWSERALISLVKSLARCERSVKTGHVNPWVELECALLTAVKRAR